jgi:hypothetical protein
VQQILDLVQLVPTPVWGRGELHAGEMWNSNSITAWLLARAGVASAASEPPGNGRAPGWDAGELKTSLSARRRNTRSIASCGSSWCNRLRWLGR